MTAAPDPAPPASRWRWAPLLLLAAAWIAHASVRDHGWVLDDVALVRDNPNVARGPAAIPEILAEGSKTGVAMGSYGPVAIASFAVEAPLWRRSDGSLRVSGFHLTNLLLHGLCVLLLFQTVLAWAPERRVLALAAALVVAVHPLHAGTVSALMGRAAILAACFALASALAWRRYGGARWGWLPAAALLWLLAILSHGAALGLPLALLILDRVSARSDPGVAGRGLARLGWTSFLVPLVVYAFVAGTPGSPAGLIEGSFGTRLLVGCEGLARSVIAFIVPVGLRGDHTDEALAGARFAIDAAAWWALGLLVVATAVAAVQVLRRQAGTATVLWLVTLALALPAICVLPTGAPLEAAWAYVVLVPLALVCGLLAEGLLRLRGSTPAFVQAQTAMMGALVLVCLVGLSQREASAWRDDDVFHERLLERNPRHVRAMVRFAASQRRVARRLREESSGLRFDAPRRDRLIARKTAALVKADRWSSRAVRHELGRKTAEAWRTRGLVLLELQHSANALEALERARDLDPLLRQSHDEMQAGLDARRRADVAEMFAGIARAREALGGREAAADAYVAAASLAPDAFEYSYRAGMALCRVNRYAEGLRMLMAARRLTKDPDSLTLVDTALRSNRDSARSIARRLLAEGHAARDAEDMRKAVTLYEQVVDVNPASVEGWTWAGWLRGQWFGNYELAERYFAEAARLLATGDIPRDDPRWKRIAGFRKLLKQQIADEAAEHAAGENGK